MAEFGEDVRNQMAEIFKRMKVLEEEGQASKTREEASRQREESLRAELEAMRGVARWDTVPEEPVREQWQEGMTEEQVKRMEERLSAGRREAVETALSIGSRLQTSDSGSRISTAVNVKTFVAGSAPKFPSDLAMYPTWQTNMRNFIVRYDCANFMDASDDNIFVNEDGM